MFFMYWADVKKELSLSPELVLPSFNGKQLYRTISTFIHCLLIPHCTLGWVNHWLEEDSFSFSNQVPGPILAKYHAGPILAMSITVLDIKLGTKKCLNV